MTEPKLNIAHILHITLCEKTHSDAIVNTDPDLCEWYTEDQMENSWEREDHQKWLKVAEQFILDVSGDEPDEKKAEQILSKLLDLSKNVSFLVLNNPKVAPWIAKLMTRSI